LLCARSVCRPQGQAEFGIATAVDGIDPYRGGYAGSATSERYTTTSEPRALPKCDEPRNDRGNRARNPLAAAERMRLHRERRRQGLRCLMIELHVTEIDSLVGLGLLKAEMRDDPGEVSVALYEHLNRTLGAMP
jgi:hypothetical protein